MNNLKLILVLWTIWGQAFAVSSLPGGVSLTQLGRPATDLVFKGKLLTIPEAYALRERGEDLAALNPKESDIWRNRGFSAPIWTPQLSGKKLIYQSSLLSRLGNFRFTAKDNSDLSRQEGYVFLVGKKSFNTLLRHKLLKKLGYNVEPIKRVKKVEIIFSTEKDKKDFIEEMTQATFADPRSSRWVVDEGAKHLVLQDVVVMPQWQKVYNLSIGAMSADIIKGRRIFNSLLAVYNLLDITESMNLLSFESHRVFGTDLVLSYELAREFSPNKEDIQWILRRLAQLTRKDWEDVVLNAELPQPVGLILLEKIISRRNSLLKAAQVSYQKIDFNATVSSGEFLKNGKILKENWEGYASRFAYGDPETPLSSSEIANFFKSKLLSNVISNSLSFFNNKFLKPDLSTQSIIQKQFDTARLNYLFKVFEGNSRKTDLYFFTFPTVGGQVITSRSVNIGGIDGGESKIMLADSFGFRLNGGVRVGTFDFPVVTDIKAGTELGISRVYTHLTPLLSLKKALKTPFRNIIVNWSQKATYKKCRPILTMTKEISEEIVDECYKVLDEQFEVGESLIITDNIDFNGNFTYTQNFNELLRASLRFRTNGVTLRRTHLHRVSKDEFHLYIDHGLKGGLTLGLSANYGFQVLSLRHETTKGLLKTKYYPWPLQAESSVQDRHKFLRGLVRFLTDAKSDLIREQVNPFELSHNFKTHQNDFNFLVWQNQWRNQRVRSKITHADDLEGEFTKEFLTYSKGKRSGKNYTQLLSQTIGEIFVQALDEDQYGVDFGNDRDPANTPFGHSHSREVILESEVIKNGRSETLDEPIVKIQFNWRGWKIKKKKAKEIVDDINQKFSFPFFHDDVFVQTKNIQVYNIGIQISLYEEFIEKLMKLDPKIIKKYLENNYSRADLGKIELQIQNEREGRVAAAMSRLNRYQRDWIRYRKNSDQTNKAIKALTKYISSLEAHIPFKDLIKLVDSNEYFAIGSVQGFREGDESGDQAFFSHGLGQMGAPYSRGKLSYLRDTIGMISSEFFGHWFMGRL